MEYVNYYENRVQDAHKQWLLAVEEGKPVSAAQHKKEYLAYKEAYEKRMAGLGLEARQDL